MRIGTGGSVSTWQLCCSPIPESIDSGTDLPLDMLGRMQCRATHPFVDIAQVVALCICVTFVGVLPKLPRHRLSPIMARQLYQMDWMSCCRHAVRSGSPADQHASAVLMQCQAAALCGNRHMHCT
jgi:hypothetical protein